MALCNPGYCCVKLWLSLATLWQMYRLINMSKAEIDAWSFTLVCCNLSRFNKIKERHSFQTQLFTTFNLQLVSIDYWPSLGTQSSVPSNGWVTSDAWRSLRLSSLQECKSLHFPARTVEMPNTDALPYLMYKGMRGALFELKDDLNDSLERELNRISDKGPCLWRRIFVMADADRKCHHFPCFFALFLVVSLKEAGNQSAAGKIKGIKADVHSERCR